MAQSLKLSFVLVLVAYLGPGRAAHISLPSYHEETSLLSAKGIDPCARNPCSEGAFCQPRFGSSYVCLCLAGDFYDYNEKICTRGKVFPGKIDKLSSIYWDAYADKTSFSFWKISSKIEKDIKLVLSAPNDGFIRSTVLKVEQYKPTFGPFDRHGVSATVEIIYNVNASITTAKVEERINSTQCNSCLGRMTFIGGDLCKYKKRHPCDNDTTAGCSSGNGSFNCSCKAGYIPLTDRECIETTTTTPTTTPTTTTETTTTPTTTTETTTTTPTTTTETTTTTPTTTTETTTTTPTTTTGPTSTTPDNTPTPTTETTTTAPTTTIVCPDGQYLVDSKCVDCPFGFSGRNCCNPWLLILVIVGSILGGLLLIALILLPIVACASSGKCCRRTKNAKPEAPRIPRASAPRSWDTNSLEMSLRQGHSNPRYVHDNGRRFNH